MSEARDILIHCPQCSSPDILAEAEVSWNIELQKWEIENISETKTCTQCKYKGDDFLTGTIVASTKNSNIIL